MTFDFASGSDQDAQSTAVEKHIWGATVPDVCWIDAGGDVVTY